MQNLLLSLVEEPKILKQGKEDSLGRDKRYDLILFLMHLGLSINDLPSKGRRGRVK